MIKPSSVAVISPPMEVSPSLTAFIRSDSFTLSSAASFTTVRPSAKAAAMAITGSSSMRAGMISPSMVVPLSLSREYLTSISAVSSPPERRLSTSSISAFISLYTLSMPALVGLMPTFFMRSSEPGTSMAAVMKYAAEDISEGTDISQA